MLIDWFEWNGVKSTEYGVHALSFPSILRPQERVERVTIPGRAGSLTRLEGENVFNDIVMAVGCVIDDPYGNVSYNGVAMTRVAAVSRWLCGSGEVIFANRQEGYYKARVANQISFDKILRGNPHLSIQVQFQCDPFLYLNSGKTTVTVTGGTRLMDNPGTLPSKPLLRVNGTGEGSVISGTSVITIESFEDAGYVYLDCDSKIPYIGDGLESPFKFLGSRVSGDWPEIGLGQTHLSYTGGITSIVVTPRWRCI